MATRWILVGVGLVLVVGCTFLAVYRSRTPRPSTIDFSFLNPYITEDETTYYKEDTPGPHPITRYIELRELILSKHSTEVSKMMVLHFNSSNGWSGGLDRGGMHGIGFFAESTTQPGDEVAVGGFEGGESMASHTHILSKVEVSIVRMKHPGEDVFKYR